MPDNGWPKPDTTVELYRYVEETLGRELVWDCFLEMIRRQKELSGYPRRYAETVSSQRRVSGFRPGHAPPGKLAESFEPLRGHNDFVNSVIRGMSQVAGAMGQLWPELALAARNHIEEAGAADAEALEPEPFCEQFDVFVLPLCKRYSDNDAGRLRALVLDAILRKAGDEIIADDDLEAEEQLDDAGSVPPDNAATVDELTRVFICSLDEVEPASPLWDSIDDLFGQIVKLAERKRNERDQPAAVTSDVRELLNEIDGRADMLAAMGLAPLRWDWFDDCDHAAMADAMSIAARILASLDEHGQRDGLAIADRDERRVNRLRLGELEDQIAADLESLDRIVGLGRPTDAGAVPADPPVVNEVEDVAAVAGALAEPPAAEESVDAFHEADETGVPDAAQPDGEPQGPSPTAVTSDPQPADQDGQESPDADVACRVGETLEEMARWLASSSPDDERRLDVAERLFWGLVGSDRTGYAARLASAFEASDRERGLTPRPLSSLGRAMVAGPRVNAPFDAAAEMLARDAGEVQSLLSDDRNSLAEGIAAIAACLRASLFAPETGAADVLEAPGLDGNHAALIRLRHAIASRRDRFNPLTPAQLAGVAEIDAWRDRVEFASLKTREWQQLAEKGRINYAPASVVLSTLSKPGGALSQQLAPALDNDVSLAAALGRQLAQLEAPGALDRLIRESWRKLRGAGGERARIDGMALEQLERRLKEGVQAARAWLDVVGERPIGDQTTRDRVSRLKGQISAEADAAVRELHRDLEGGHDLRAAAVCMLKALEGLNSFTASGTSQPECELPTLEEALNADLARLGSDQPVTLGRLLEFVSDGVWDWATNVRNMIDRGDHLGVERALDWLRHVDGAEQLVIELEADAARALRADRESLRNLLEQADARIERASLAGLLDESTRADLRGRLAAIDVDSTMQSGRDLASAREVHETVGQLIADRAAELQRALADLGEIEPSVSGRVEALIAERAFVTAEDYIERIRSGKGLPAGDESERRAVITPADIRQLVDVLATDAGRAERVCKALGAGTPIGPVRTLELPVPQRQSAEQIAKAWFALKRAGNDPSVAIREYLLALGFSHVSVMPVAETRQGYRRFVATVAPLADRTICPVPELGSLRNGRYDILTIEHGISTPSEIVTAARSVGDNVIVFYLGRLKYNQRADLAAETRRQRRTVLVVDDVASVWIAAARGNRVAALFATCLPYSYAAPYKTTASLVPPEMFFGREREQRAILDPFGTSLIYGGRQLGKTALIRHVERTNHDPGAGRIVVWRDLKTLGIGGHRPFGEIWAVISDTLKEFGIVRGASKPEVTSRSVKEWLAVDTSRSILLLLDEADGFLSGDGDPERGPARWQHLMGLKQLMDDTNRRFKVVFAGLHDVQRTALDVNSPVAHLGHPICIGPLFADDAGRDDARQALELVTQPLGALGFNVGVDVAIRILSLTNYYPSLIQVFGEKFVERAAASAMSGPPFEVTTRFVEETFASGNVRDEIRRRVEMTLHLDPRYGLIAYLVALASIEARQVLDEGLDALEIRTEAMSWWRAGFAAAESLEAIKALLEEMVGLGILRRVGASRYALRAANVLTLLGRREEIEESFTRLAAGPVPRPYSTASFRRHREGDVVHRSPLTEQQEVRLLGRTHGVHVVFGTPLGRIERVAEYLELAASANAGARLVKLAPEDHGAFARELETISRSLADDVTVVVVGHESAWAAAWVETAAATVRRKRSQSHVLHVVFVGGPGAAYRWVRDGGVRDADEIWIERWAEDTVGAWLSDNSFTLDTATRQRLDRATGGWPARMERYGEIVCGDAAGALLAIDAIEAEEVGDIGIGADERRHLLAELATGEADRADVAELVGIEPDSAALIVRWAELIGYLHVLDDVCSVDPIVARAIAPR